MNVLKGILKESQEYYLGVQKKINRKLSKLARGSIKERNIAGKKYYYLQHRMGNKVIQKYLGRKKPDQLIKAIQLRKSLKVELKKVDEALKMLNRTQGKSRG